MTEQKKNEKEQHKWHIVLLVGRTVETQKTTVKKRQKGIETQTNAMTPYSTQSTHRFGVVLLPLSHCTFGLVLKTQKTSRQTSCQLLPTSNHQLNTIPMKKDEKIKANDQSNCRKWYGTAVQIEFHSRERSHSVHTSALAHSSLCVPLVCISIDATEMLLLLTGEQI